MALNLSTVSLHPNPSSSSSSFSFMILIAKQKHLFKHSPSSPSLAKSPFRRSASSETSDTEVTEGSSSSACSQIDLLEQLTSTSSPDNGYMSDDASGKLTIRDQLAQLVRGREDDFSIPLGKNLKKVSSKFLTISQKRNIKRQAYLNEVSQRNDSSFFATIGAFVILPPVIQSIVSVFRAKIPAIIVFGDSSVDSGNNNFIPTIARCNFESHGRDFPGGRPTGRFCNGRLPTD